MHFVSTVVLFVSFAACGVDMPAIGLNKATHGSLSAVSERADVQVPGSGSVSVVERAAPPINPDFCSAEDQENGLCNGPFDTAVARSKAVIAAENPGADPIDLIDCTPVPGALLCLFQFSWGGHDYSILCAMYDEGDETVCDGGPN